MMRRFLILYLAAFAIAISGMLPDVVSDALLMVILGTAPIVAMRYIIGPPARSGSCPPHDWPKPGEGSMVCKRCGYKPGS